MNGRVYDPALGRFLSPDPNIQFVADLQSYNRYSYVLNNPLRYTDPTGYYGSTGGNFNASQFAFGALVGIALSGACGYGAGACIAASLVIAGYTATTMYMSGASTNQIIAASAISIAAGAVGGAVGGMVTQGMGGGVGAAMVGGAVSAMASTVITTAAMGGSLGSNDFLFGVISGAVLAGISAGMNSNWISEAYSAEAQGEGGSGAAFVETRSIYRAVVGAHYDEIDAVIATGIRDYDAGVALGPDANTDAALDTLDPSIKESARQHIRALREMGIDARVGRASVTKDEQAKTYAKVKAEYGKDASVAPAGKSIHEIGKAYDVQLWEKGMLIKSNEHPWYNVAGSLGMDLDSQWGVTKPIPKVDSLGVWHPDSWRDYRHFQVPHDQL